MLIVNVIYFSITYLLLRSYGQRKQSDVFMNKMLVFRWFEQLNGSMVESLSSNASHLHHVIDILVKGSLYLDSFS